MSRLLKGIFPALIVAVAAILSTPVASAQDDGAAKPKPAAKPAAKPSPAAAAAPGAESDEDKPKPIEKISPAVEAVLDSKPTTPEQRIRAVKILTDLGRPDLAKPLLEQVVAESLSPEQLVELLERFGSATFVDLAGQPKLQPEGQKLAKAIAEAASTQLQDVKRLDDWIAQLDDASAEVRQKAVAGLTAARESGVQRLLLAMGDEARAGLLPRVRKVLMDLGPVAQPGLIAVLQSGDERLTREAIGLLVRMNAREAVVYLLAPLHAQAESVREAARAALVKLGGPVLEAAQGSDIVAERARRYYQRRLEPRSVEGQAIVWHWDAEQKQPVFRSLRTEDSARAIARHLAADAHALASNDPRIARLYVSTILDAAAYEAGLDKPLPDEAEAEAEKLGLAAVEESLMESLTDGHPAVSAAAARILGQKGSAEKNVYRPNEIAPLVLATRSGDRRVRMAALESIMQLKPALPYPGSSFVVEALDFLAGTRGSRRVLAAAPHRQAAMEMAGPLVELGYAIETATTGRELVRAVLECPDYELVLIDTWVANPTPDVVVQQLRRDNRSADLLVLLLAHDGQLPRAEAAARGVSLTLAFPRPHDAATLKWQLAQVTALAGQEFVPFELRQQQAAQALQWLAELARGPAFYPIARAQNAALAALDVPDLGARAVSLIATIGRPEGQRALVDLAGRPSAPVELRQAAVDALHQSIQSYGILLTSNEILLQYDRYNQTPRDDETTHALLGRVLDSLESPAKAKTNPAAPKPKAESEPKASEPK